MDQMMDEFPPAPGRQVTLANWRTRPFCQWAFHHVREILPTATIHHDPAAVRMLEAGPSLEMPAIADEALGYSAFLDATDTDALVVLHRGRMVHETYRSGMTARDPHLIFSIAKSMMGLLAGALVGDGRLDTGALVTAYIPEIAGSAWDGATVRHLLDMRAGVRFSEDYLADDGLIVEYRKAGGWNPPAPGDKPSDLRSFLASMTGREGRHGGPVVYQSPQSDLLGWVIERAAGRRYADLYSDLIWSKIGAEAPADITVDRLGAPRTAGGISVTTRDLARVGQLMVEGGGGIVPKSWVEDIATAGDREAWSAGSIADVFPGEDVRYRSKWYNFPDRGGIMMGIGIHSQNLVIDRAAELVLARQGSSDTPLNPASERRTLALFEAIRKRLA